MMGMSIKNEVLVNNSQFGFEKLSPSDLAKKATTEILEDIFASDMDTSCHVHMIFNGEDARELTNNIKYYAFMHGYAVDAAELISYSKENWIEPSKQIVNDFFTHHEILSKNFKFALKRTPDKIEMQKKLKKVLDRTLDEYLLNLVRYNDLD